MWRNWATKLSWKQPRRPTKLCSESSRRLEEKNIRTKVVLPQKPRDLRKSRLQKAELEKAKTAESTIAGPAYDLFCKLLRDDPETQWDQIVSNMHSKNPWEDLKGYKRMNLRPKSYVSLLECIEFHKRTFFTVDAAEKLRYYLVLYQKARESDYQSACH